MPPPRTAAFALTVLRTTLSTPPTELKTPPPLPPASLFETVHSVSVSVPWLRIAPPSSALPFEKESFETLTTTPGSTLSRRCVLPPLRDRTFAPGPTMVTCQRLETLLLER